MNKKLNRLLVIGLVAASVITACKKDKDLVPVPQPVENEPEVITTMKLMFVDSSNASNVYYATFRDPDGDGGTSFDIFDTIILQPNKTWYTSILLLNETVSPIDTVSNDVLEEANDHKFCFTPAGVSATVQITDLDGNGLPVGLQSKWRTSGTGSGTMQVELRHQPGTKDGTCTSGETDISVVFPTKIQ
ncbi:hypothetical protein [Fluviicola chungangensis]|uniref:Type 1 periplasmic binding fold superfamily protein n=1 Tax=Fluviicola chungangensis TaxID=2597671 RepID=A0A556N3T0_9FLAO|nr:hypothetical protein [Fluviicola chungangensis]TSJ46745.1 hypothetical protein FO442_06175 [Fluviicola chungangensis]